MKIIYYINNIAFGITLLLYLTVIYGLIMQVFLGGIQIVLFLILLFKWKRFPKTSKIHLITYGILTLVYMLLFTSNIATPNESWIFISVIPMSIAAYFTYIVYQLKKQLT